MEAAALAVGVAGTLAGLVGWGLALPSLTSSSNKSRHQGRRTYKDDVNGLKVATGSSSSPEIDICFVHGLNGDAETTWTARNKETGLDVFWPTELLGHDSPPGEQPFPKARILTYGYETKVNSLCWLTERTLYQHGHLLLSLLAKERADCQERPLVFVAHSLGGLLVKSTLIFAQEAGNSTPNEEAQIYLSTVGVVSFGTPQNFAANGPWYDMVDRLCQMPNQTWKFEDYQSNTWKRDVQVLQRKLNGYQPLAMEIPEVFCYESSRTYDSKERISTKKITVPSPFTSDRLHHLSVAVPIQADHASMCKFSTPNNELREIRRSMCKFFKESGSVLQRRRTDLTETEEFTPGLSTWVKDFSVASDLPPKIPFISHKTEDSKSREEYLDDLERHLIDDRVAVLNGPLGNGKTTLALEYAYRNKSGAGSIKFNPIFWIDAGSELAIQKSFMRIIRQLRAHYIRNDKEEESIAIFEVLDSLQLNDDGVPEHNEDLIFTIRFIWDWLYYPDNESWLLIFDDVEHSEATYLRQYLPRRRGDRGYIIMTSRADHEKDTISRQHQIEVGPYSQRVSRSSTESDDTGHKTRRDGRGRSQSRPLRYLGDESRPTSPVFLSYLKKRNSDWDPADEEDLSNLRPIRVGTFNRNESVELIGTIYEGNAVPFEHDVGSKHQSYDEIAEQFSDNPLRMTYGIGGDPSDIARSNPPETELTQPAIYYDTSGQDITEKTTERRYQDHQLDFTGIGYAFPDISRSDSTQGDMEQHELFKVISGEVPKEYSAWIDSAVMLASDPIPIIVLQHGLGITEEAVLAGLKKLRKKNLVGIDFRSKTFMIAPNYRRARRQFLSGAEANTACKLMIETIKQMTRKDSRRDSLARSIRSAQEQQLLKHVRACLEHLARNQHFVDCEWDILAAFCERHGLHNEAASFFSAAHGQEIPNSDTQTQATTLFSEEKQTRVQDSKWLDSASQSSHEEIMYVSEATRPERNTLERVNTDEDTRTSRKLRIELGLVRNNIAVGDFRSLESQSVDILQRVQRKSEPRRRGRARYESLKRDALNQRILVSIAQEDWANAVESSYELIEDLEGVFGPSSEATIEAQHQLAMIHMQKGDYGGAIPILKQILMTRQLDSFANSSLKSMPISEHLARAYKEQGQLEKARDLYQSLIGTLRKDFRNDHIRTAKVRENLAIVQEMLEEYSTADYEYAQALDSAKAGSEEEYKRMSRNHRALQQRRKQKRLSMYILTDGDWDMTPLPEDEADLD